MRVNHYGVTGTTKENQIIIIILMYAILYVFPK